LDGIFISNGLGLLPEGISGIAGGTAGIPVGTADIAEAPGIAGGTMPGITGAPGIPVGTADIAEAPGISVGTTGISGPFIFACFAISFASCRSSIACFFRAIAEFFCLCIKSIIVAINCSYNIFTLYTIDMHLARRHSTKIDANSGKM